MRLKQIIIQCFLVLPLLALNHSTNAIDILLEESHQKFGELQYIESLQLSEKALELTYESNYDKGRIYSYLYITRVLQEVGLKRDALNYIEKIKKEKYYQTDAFVQAETHRLNGRIASSQGLYNLEKEHYLKQLQVSEQISDANKRNLSILSAYFFIQHMYVKQNDLDSVEVYQDLLIKHFSANPDSIGRVYYITLYADKGLIYKNLGRYDEAAEQLDKALLLAQNGSSSLLFYFLQIYGDLDMERGDTAQAIIHYTKALEHSANLHINHKTMYLHKRLSDCLLHNEQTIDEAKNHLKEYNIINDSLESHNKMLADRIISGVIEEREKESSRKTKYFSYLVVTLIIVFLSIGTYLMLRNRRNKQRLIKKNQQLLSTTEKIELLEEALESTIFQDIITLAKNNNPEFLSLFGKGHPEFIQAMKKLDPSIRSSELHFCALSYLNFSTKDIANYTFVTIRAVQVRKNRLRKKYNIPSEIDLNEWFRNVGVDASTIK